ncbi:MAG: alanine--tRNA ligase [Patescibacteria group bacterium]|jgi:alanyl-tRNA synthetase
MITREQLIQKYREFFESHGHKWVAGASLVPENDPTVLFTTAGMHPLVPYLMGENHAEGKRIANAQKCIRTDDIDEVGDATHQTFFEMLGNWSFGDYFKSEAIQWSYEFLTDPKWLGLDVAKLAVTVFAGDQDAPFDTEAYDLWIKTGIKPQRIAKLPKSDNWWGPAGQVGPCGPDTEMFYWTGSDKAPAEFDPKDTRWVEIWNNVFMQYNKTEDGKFVPLKQTNVDTGMGLVRTLAVINGQADNYQTELFWLIIQKIEQISGKKYADHLIEFRIVADHITAAIFAIADDVLPSNKGAGYITRRLIRRAISKMHALGVKGACVYQIGLEVVHLYQQDYSKLADKSILETLEQEEKKFLATLVLGLKQLDSCKNPDGKFAFNLFQTYGFPVEMTMEQMRLQKIGFDKGQLLREFGQEMTAHQDLSRTASAGMFKGGLADASEITTKYHTATHLLQAALRQVLGTEVYQRGSNITAERMRFDFSYPDKMTDDQIAQVEQLVNGWIKDSLVVQMEEMSPAEAKQSGALGIFDDKYGSKVKVYSVGKTSREICGGPHVSNTKELGLFKITKEEASSAGVRRIKATLI